MVGAAAGYCPLGTEPCPRAVPARRPASLYFNPALAALVGMSPDDLRARCVGGRAETRKLMTRDLGETGE